MSKAKQAKWESMTPRERKVAIAKDVIAQVQAGNYQIEASYGYIEPLNKTGVNKTINEHFRKTRNLDRPLSKTDIEVMTKSCAMCARGAALMSRIRMFNSIKVGDVAYLVDDDYNELSNNDLKAGEKPTGADLAVHQSSTTKGLAGSFTELELSLIEVAFERTGWLLTSSTVTNRDRLRQAIEFGQQFEDDSDRLLAIMQNIVDNDGVFRPAQEYEIVSY